MESPLHRAYKSVAIDILKEKGFEPREIHEEHDVEYAVNGRVKYTVDIVGVKDNYRVAIECGQTELSKLTNLRKMFDEVIWVNAKLVIELYDQWKSRYYTEIGKLQKENVDLSNRAEYVVRKANADFDRLQRERDDALSKQRKLEIQIRSLQKVIAEAWSAMKEQS